MYWVKHKPFYGIVNPYGHLNVSYQAGVHRVILRTVSFKEWGNISFLVNLKSKYERSPTYQICCSEPLVKYWLNTLHRSVWLFFFFICMFFDMNLICCQVAVADEATLVITAGREKKTRTSNLLIWRSRMAIFFLSSGGSKAHKMCERAYNFMGTHLDRTFEHEWRM